MTVTSTSVDNTLHSSSITARARVADPTVMSVRKVMLLEFLALLERNQIRYVILAGYQGYPSQIDSDIDFMVSDADFKKLPELLGRNGALTDAKLLQILRHETSACYFVLARQVGIHLAYLHPDAAANYRRRGRLWLRADDVLATRRKHPAGFWIPSAAMEFEYYFVKRIDKAAMQARHLLALKQLASEEPEQCRQVVSRLLPLELAQQAIKALMQEDEVWFISNRQLLQSSLSAGQPHEGIFERIRHQALDLSRNTKRIAQPTGMSLTVLGPDGSGKTTVIEHLERELSPAFRKTRRFHFRPRFGAAQHRSSVTNPHGEKPRSTLASVGKITYFVADYLWSWLTVIHPGKIRSTLLIFDRYFHDMLVDPIRYRLPTHGLPTAMFARMIPSPNLWLILTARPATLVERKGEITEEAAARLVTSYKALAMTQKNAVAVDTEESLESTLATALRCATDVLHQRAMMQLNLKTDQ